MGGFIPPGTGLTNVSLSMDVPSAVLVVHVSRGLGMSQWDEAYFFEWFVTSWWAWMHSGYLKPVEAVVLQHSYLQECLECQMWLCTSPRADGQRVAERIPSQMINNRD